MSTVTVTRTIDAAPARVWALLTDLPRRDSWLSTVDDVRVATRGPFGAGTVWRESRTMADGTHIMEEFRVSEYSAPWYFVVTSPGRGATYRTTYRLDPIRVGRHRGGTAVTIEQEGRPCHATGKVLELVLGGLAARTVEGELRQELTDLAWRATEAEAGEEPTSAGERPAA